MGMSLPISSVFGRLNARERQLLAVNALSWEPTATAKMPLTPEVQRSKDRAGQHVEPHHEEGDEEDVPELGLGDAVAVAGAEDEFAHNSTEPGLSLERAGTGQIDGKASQLTWQTARKPPSCQLGTIENGPIPVADTDLPSQARLCGRVGIDERLRFLAALYIKDQ